MKTAFDLKTEGHLLIYDLQGYGWSKNRVYNGLAKRLKIPQEKAHFGKMILIGELERAVECLKKMVGGAIVEDNKRRRIERKRLKALEPLKPKKKHGKVEVVLPRAQYLEAMARLKAEREGVVDIS